MSKKILVSLLPAAFLAMGLNAIQVEISYYGGADEDFGSIQYENNEFSQTGNSVGLFVVLDDTVFDVFSAGPSVDAFNLAIQSNWIDIIDVTTIDPVFNGGFTSGTTSDLYYNTQVYLFAFDAPPTESEAGWQFSHAGIWTNSEWLTASGELPDTTSDFDLGTLDPLETIWGNQIAVSTEASGSGYAAIMAPALAPIPEPSTYALMMMGVALGYTIYRRRKQS